MPSWTKDDLIAFHARRAGIRPNDPKPIEGNALVSVAPRKAKSRTGTTERIKPRFRIVFRIYAVRPCDWDGYSIKELQDCLVKSKLLDGDEWNILEGQVISCKAHSKEQERTEIELIPMTQQQLGTTGSPVMKEGV